MSERECLNVEIRRLWPSGETFRDHLLRLDARSRHERFSGGMSDHFLLHYAEHCFGQGDLLYGAFVDGHLCGAAELRSNQAIWREQAPFDRHIHAAQWRALHDATDTFEGRWRSHVQFDRALWG